LLLPTSCLNTPMKQNQRNKEKQSQKPVPAVWISCSRKKKFSLLLKHFWVSFLYILVQSILANTVPCKYLLNNLTEWGRVKMSGRKKTREAKKRGEQTSEQTALIHWAESELLDLGGGREQLYVWSLGEEHCVRGCLSVLGKSACQGPSWMWAESTCIPGLLLPFPLQKHGVYFHLLINLLEFQIPWDQVLYLLCLLNLFNV
jgi:hypothetical protein